MPEELAPYSSQDLVRALEKEAGRIEEDALHSAKGHFNTASGWSKVHYILGLPAAVLAAWAGFNAFSDNFELTAILAITSATLGAINTFLNPNQKTAEHKNAGREFNALKNRARLFREIQLPSSSTQEAREILQYVFDKRDELNSVSPDIPRWAYDRAVKDIDARKAEYQVDKGAR